jgi:hypothetical protein
LFRENEDKGEEGTSNNLEFLIRVTKFDFG